MDGSRVIIAIFSATNCCKRHHYGITDTMAHWTSRTVTVNFHFRFVHEDVFVNVIWQSTHILTIGQFSTPIYKHLIDLAMRLFFVCFFKFVFNTSRRVNLFNPIKLQSLFLRISANLFHWIYNNCIIAILIRNQIQIYTLRNIRKPVVFVSYYTDRCRAVTYLYFFFLLSFHQQNLAYIQFEW